MKTINGDLLEIKSGLILHQVNCTGATGGLAGALRRKWPKAFEIYTSVCRHEKNDRIDRRLGTFLIGDAGTNAMPPKLLIGHIFGQVSPGPHTNMMAVDLALNDLKFEMRKGWAAGVRVYAPHLMGCGLGGGNWDEYSRLLEKHFPDITIVKKY